MKVLQNKVKLKFSIEDYIMDIAWENAIEIENDEKEEKEKLQFFLMRFSIFVSQDSIFPGDIHDVIFN